jgi:archaemetzincin
MDSPFFIPELRIVPLGRVDSEILDFLALTLPVNIGSGSATVGTAISLQPAYDPLRRQYHSTRLLGKLLETSAGTADKILGVTEGDLFIPILTFVFGEAQLGGKVALISLHRLRQSFYGLPEDKRLLYSRAEKEATHELGHACGLVHCHSYDCVMHFSNSIEQVDLKPSLFCGSCEGVLRALDPRSKEPTYHDSRVA